MVNVSSNIRPSLQPYSLQLVCSLLFMFSSRRSAASWIVSLQKSALLSSVIKYHINLLCIVSFVLFNSTGLVSLVFFTPMNRYASFSDTFSICGIGIPW